MKRRSAADLLQVAAITPEGLLIRQDSIYVRYLNAGTVNPLTLDPEECERVSAAFAQLAARLPARQSLQLYVQAVPLDVEAILAEEAFRCEQAAGAAIEAGEPARAAAIRRLGEAQEQSIRVSAANVAPLKQRFLLICPWRPTGLPVLGKTCVKADVHQRAVRESLRHAEGIQGDLETMGIDARLLGGAEVLDLLHERFDPDAQLAGAPSASFMHPQAVQALRPGETAAQARERAERIARAVCTAPVSFRSRSHLRIGESAEQAFYVGFPPEQTWLGWLLHLMQAPRPYAISVHLEATDRFRERMAQRRRFKRLYGVNRGVELAGRPVDPDARAAEQEAAELNEELAASSGAGIYKLSIYAALREHGPDPDVEALGELCQSTGREITMTSDARIANGLFAQRPLWASTLPLGHDCARRRHRYLSRNVGDSFPFTGTGYGASEGIALGYAMPGRSLERLDPFAEAHPNHLLLLNGMSGAGKTMAALIILIRAIAQGATGWVIDRAGHFDFLASLIPGAVSLEIGGDGHAINAWDVGDPANVTAEKIDYLLALHALLLGEHHADRDSYGITDLESNLLGLAIGEVYQRCALTGEEPRELLLQEELERRYETERAEGSVGIAESLRNLSMRLANYTGDGPYAYLADRPTTIPAGAPLVVFDTRSIPEAKAAAVLFVICEYVKREITRTRAEHMAGQSPKHAWAGRTFLAVDEAWKLIERPATGRWFNEFCRRSRHYALLLVAISQQLSDFDCEYGKALLANATMCICLRQLARELAYVKAARQLSDEAITAISELRTVKGSHSMAYVINGSIWEGTVQIGVGAMEYWIAATDPARDEHVRQRALRQTSQNADQALDLLIDEDWQQQAALELEATG